MKRTTTTYTCDICGKEPSYGGDFTHVVVPIYMVPVDTQGREYERKRMVRQVEVDVCHDCRSKVTRLEFSMHKSKRNLRLVSE